MRTYSSLAALTCGAACQPSSSHSTPCPLCQLMQRIGPVGSRRYTADYALHLLLGFGGNCSRDTSQSLLLQTCMHMCWTTTSNSVQTVVTVCSVFTLHPRQLLNIAVLHVKSLCRYVSTYVIVTTGLLGRTVFIVRDPRAQSARGRVQ